MTSLPVRSHGGTLQGMDESDHGPYDRGGEVEAWARSRAATEAILNERRCDWHSSLGQPTYPLAGATVNSYTKGMARCRLANGHSGECNFGDGYTKDMHADV